MFAERIGALPPGCEVVVLPEMFNTGFSMNASALAEQMDGPTLQWMKRLAAQKRLIITGSLIIEENSRFFNRLIWMLPNGQMGHYDKRHLFAYAGEDVPFTAGSRRLIASVKGWKLNLQVCYDLRFPVWARQSESAFDQARVPPTERSGKIPEYDVLVYVANWPERRAHAWKTLLQARAIENQAYVVGVNRVGNDGHEIYHSGDTMVIDPMGTILYTMQHKEDVHTTTLDKTVLQEIRKKLPFLNDADDFLIQT